MLNVSDVKDEVKASAAGSINTDNFFDSEEREADLSPVSGAENKAQISSSNNRPAPQTPVDKFLAQLDDARATVEKYRDQLYETLTAAYKASVFYFEQDDKTRKELKAQLVARYEAAGFKATKKTVIEHMVLKSTFGMLSDATVSNRAIALKAARDENIAVCKFTGWVEGKGGIQAVVSAYRQEKNGTDKPLSRSDLIKQGQEKIANNTSKTFKADEMGSFVAEAVAQDTEAVAIVVRHPGGGFTLKGFTTAQAAICEAYAAFGK